MTRQGYTWVLPRTSLELGTRTVVMGIVNVTPDSFSDGGLYLDTDKAVAYAKELEDAGADIVDIGGESTRPGNQPVSEEEEICRVLPVIERMASVSKVPVSIDTYRDAVARRAIDAGAQIVNDISGLRYSPGLPQIVRTARAGLVLMHSRGARYEIHQQPPTDDPVQTAVDGLAESLETARKAGIDQQAIVIDPGIGFSKNAAASFKILKSIEVFSRLRFPLLVGTSRKSFLRAVFEDNPESRLLGTAATVVAAIVGGAHIVRVHDVRQMRLVADVADRILMA